MNMQMIIAVTVNIVIFDISFFGVHILYANIF